MKKIAVKGVLTILVFGITGLALSIAARTVGTMTDVDTLGGGESVVPDLASHESSSDGVPPADFKVAFIGDQDRGSSATAVLQLILAEGTDLVLHQGDFDYADDPDAWDQKITDVLGPAFPYLVSVGNHDTAAWRGTNGYQAKFQQRLALIPDAYCVGDLGVNSVCIYKGLAIVLSGAGTLGSDHEAYIQQAFAADNHYWRICSWHKNMNKMQVGTLMSSFENQIIANTSSTLALDEGNSFAFVSGLGGRNIRNQDQSWPWMAAVYTSDQNANYGALFCTFNVNGQPDHADCYFKDIDGVVPDQFELVSNLAGPIPPNEPPVANDDSADRCGHQRHRPRRRPGSRFGQHHLCAHLCRPGRWQPDQQG
jgi:hypothetical protein